MKTLLINPDMKDRRLNITPLGLTYLLASLEKNGHDAELIDLHWTHYMDDLLNSLFEQNIRLACITTTTSIYLLVLELAKQIKSASPNTFITLGGPHATFEYDSILNPENNALSSGSGLTYRCGGKNCQQPLAEYRY